MIKYIAYFCMLLLFITFNSSAKNVISCKDKECKQYFKAYKKYAKNGSPVAQEILGNLYLTGYGTKVNAKKAAKWFKKSAKHGHYGARLALANMYLTGKGLKKDTEKSLSMYQELAEKSISQAAFNLGVIYGQGEYVKQDLYLAEKWLKKANTTSSKFMLARMYESDVVNKQKLSQAKAIYREIEGINPYAAYRLQVLEKNDAPKKSDIIVKAKKPTIQLAKSPKDSKMETIEVRANINDFLMDNLLAIKEQGIYNSKSGTGSRIRGKACDKSRGCNAATDPATVGRVLTFWSRHQNMIKMTESAGYGE